MMSLMYHYDSARCCKVPSGVRFDTLDADLVKGRDNNGDSHAVLPRMLLRCATWNTEVLLDEEQVYPLSSDIARTLTAFSSKSRSTFETLLYRSVPAMDRFDPVMDRLDPVMDYD